MADETHTYTTSLRWTAERRGTFSPTGLPQLEVATPPEFPGGHPGVWSPEHLFVAAAEACLMTTFLAIAGNSKLAFKEYSSQAVGTLEKTAEGYRVSRIVLRPRLVIGDAAAVERAKRILERSEQLCLISRSMKTEVTLEAEVVVAPSSAAVRVP
jgi:organic hydroperoxide reductase OsmC/OhrA